MTNTIDIEEEIIRIFKREELLAYFDISYDLTDECLLNGLCKISKPKTNSEGMKYLGLLFVFDVLNCKCLQEINRIMQAYEAGGLKRCLKELDFVIVCPSTELSSNNSKICIRQVDLVFPDSFIPGREFLEEDLLPALCATGHLPNVKLEWWPDDANSAYSQPHTTETESLTFFGRLRCLLSGQV